MTPVSQQLSDARVEHAGVATEEAAWTEIETARDDSALAPVRDIERFLSVNPHVRAALTDGARMVPLFFGPDASLSLRIEHQIEDDGEAELVAFIQTPFGVDESLVRLDRFDAGWWLDELPKVKGQLTFTLRYA